MTTKQDALNLMSADLHEVAALFEAHDGLCARQASDIEKAAVIDRIRQLLSVRAQVEDEIVAPTLRHAKLDLAALGERMQQRRSELMAQYQAMLAGAEREDESADPVGRPARSTGR
jgi:hypothetical protein